MSELVKQKTLEAETAIAGIWRADDGELWQIFKIEPDERIGRLIITYEATPPTARTLEYELIWVDDETIFIDLIQPSIQKREQYRIWINTNYIKIDLSKHQPPPKQQYLLLNKV